MADIIHIVFGEAGEIELRDALRRLGREDRVLEFPDDLGFGPIDPADAVTRAKWVAETLEDADWQEIVAPVNAFWAEVLSGAARHVVWFSRRVTRDYIGFLYYLSRIGDRPCDVVDMTEATVPVRRSDGSVRGRRRAICASFTESYQFVDGNLFSLAAPLTEETRAAHRKVWEKLRAENAPLRVVTEDLQIVSASLSYFDAAMFRQMQPRFLKAARIIGFMLAAKWDLDIYEAGDFFLSRRLLMLARAGAIEAKGDLRRIAFSEVRLPQATSGA